MRVRVPPRTPILNIFNNSLPVINIGRLLFLIIKERKFMSALLDAIFLLAILGAFALLRSGIALIIGVAFLCLLMGGC